jgi:hypothetical protein
MDKLGDLTPAETLLLIESSGASQKDLLKYTLMDLLLKGVLKTEKKKFQASPHDPIIQIKYVSKGANFSMYNSMPHEKFFLSIFLTKNISRVLFRHLIKMGYENSISKSFLHKAIYSNSDISKFIKTGFIYSIFNRFGLSNEGKEVGKKLKNEIANLEKIFPKMISSDQRKALEILTVIKGNVFLLETLDFKLLRKIDKTLLEEINAQNYSSDFGYVGCSSWSDFNDYSHSFDSSCGSGDSGCSSSGCSSGCSGCGGCGGD